MDSRSPSDSDRGGGHRGWSPPPSPHDEGRPQTRPPQTSGSPTDPGPSVSQLHSSLVLSLDQIRITGSSNEYTDGPTAAQRPPATPQRQQKSDVVSTPTSRTNGPQETQDERPNNLRNLRSPTQHGGTTNSVSSREGALRSSSMEDSQSSTRTSVGSSSSAQRLLGSPASGEQIITHQPKRCEELKPLNEESRPVGAVPGSGASGGDCKSRRIHSSRCEDCGRCQCTACRRPRALPSCWLCGRRCVCSVHNVVEYGTCVCCVKGLFYHCSSDDEDTCADKPFSCTQSHCCVRWATVSLLSVLLPCLLCYLPAKGCAAACQSCYDRATRPGCRCKNSSPAHSEEVGKPT